MKSLPDLSSDQLNKDIHLALKQWHIIDSSADQPLTKLLLVQEARRNQEPLRLAINKVLSAGLAKVKLRLSEAATILEKRFQDKSTILQVSQQMSLTEDQIKHKQRAALKLLAQVLLEMEMKARDSFIMRQESKLAAKSYSQLFGIELLSDRLLSYLTAVTSPWVITLVGIGGIGKTSLADYSVRRAIHDLNHVEVVWLEISNQFYKPNPLTGPEQTFQNMMIQLSKQLLPALSANMPFKNRLLELQNLLKSQPFLIIVDNLEWKEDTSYLLPKLVTMAAPSRFLLTSRTAPVNHSGALIMNLKELDPDNSIALMRHYAHEIGFVHAAEAKRDELLPIYEVVGGNPYALKQLVSLAQIRPLPSLLAALRKRPLTNGEEIYHHILKETWITLSDAAKAILAVMPLAAKGGMDPEQIADLSGLSEGQIWPAINDLVGRSLLEVKDSSNWARAYGIHRLTDLFIRSLINE